MPVPEWGRHAGHMVIRGQCQDDGQFLNHEDNVSPPCPACGAAPGAECDHPRHRTHEERLWLSHGHTPDEFPAMKANRQRRKTARS